LSIKIKNMVMNTTKRLHSTRAGLAKSRACLPIRAWAALRADNSRATITRP